MLILIHVRGGQPGREMGITTLRYVNAMQAMRNIFINKEHVMVMTYVS